MNASERIEAVLRAARNVLKAKTIGDQVAAHEQLRQAMEDWDA